MGAMAWRWGSALHDGGRSEQQDAVGVFPLARGLGLLAVLADGMGGHRDGALGSQAVIAAAEQFAAEREEMLLTCPPESLMAFCQQAKAAIANASPIAHTTLVALVLYQQRGQWLHVGDSRLYHFRNGTRLSRTRDHSAAQMLVEMGEITEAEMAHHPDQNRLYRSLSSSREEPPKPDLGGSLIQPEDALILCSDGVWEYIRDDELWQASQEADLTAAATRLVTEAAARGGEQADNASLILICPQQRSWWKRLWLG